MPEVSVIIPVYNVEKYLHECLESVCVQSFTDWEAICVNDGATDNSPAILKDFATKDPRFKIIEQKNSGLSAARNTGVSATTGKYIYFLDSDDLITPDALQWMYDTAERNQLELLHFAWEPFYEMGVLADPFEDRNFFNGQYDECTDGSMLFSRMAKNNDWNPGVVYRFFQREFYTSNGFAFHEGVLHEDEAFSMITDLSAKRVMRVNKVCYRRRIRAGSIMTFSSAERHLKGCLTAYDDIAAFLNTHHFSAEVEDLIQRRLACLLISAKKYLPDQPEEALLQRITDAEKFIADAEAADERANRSFAKRLLAPFHCLRENGLRYTLGRIFGKKS